MLAKWEKYITAAGVATLLGFLMSRLLPFRSDPGLAGLAIAAVRASIALELIWVSAALVYTAACRRRTSILFRVIFVLNIIALFPLVLALTGYLARS